MKTVLTLVSLLLPATAALAGQTDFARGSVLVPADGSVAQRVTTLPDDVYEWVTRADLGDLRVFNRDQEEVPYTVRRPRRKEEYTLWVSLPIFPLPPLQGDLTEDPRIGIRVNSAGTIVEFAPGGTALEPPTAFLFDATQLDFAPTELRLDWEGSHEQDFVGRVAIETSDDLNNWSTLVDGTGIARLMNDGRLIELTVIKLPPRKARYLRVSLVEGNGELVLSRAEVRRRSAELPQRRWKALTAQGGKGGFLFESGGHFPIDRVQLTAAEQSNYIVTAQLYSRERPQDEWRNRGEHRFYRTTVSGQTLESEPLALGHRDQYWRVEFDTDGLAAPVLRIGWLPDELVFLTQGPAPYVLAYGQAGVEAKEWPLQQLLQRLNEDAEAAALSEVPVARALPPEMLGGPDRLQPPPEPVDYQTIVLWSVLGLGVLLVGFLSIRLLRSGGGD